MFRQLLMALLVVPLMAGSGWAATPEELMDHGHYKRARDLIGDAKPASAHDYYLRALLERGFGNMKAAHEHAKKAVEMEPENALYRTVLAQIGGRRAQDSGLIGKMRLAGRAKKDAEKALELDGQSIEAREFLMYFHLYAPGVAGGDKKKARQMVDEMVGLDPVLGNLAAAEYWDEMKEPAKAEASLHAAHEAGPEHYDAALRLAGHYLAEDHRNLDEAERYANLARELDASQAPAYWILASVHALQDRFDDLDAVLEQAASSVPDNLYPFYRAGRTLYLEEKDMARAEAYFRKYLTQEPEPGFATHAHAQWRLGLVLEKQGRGEEALAALQTSVKIDPKLETAKKDLKRVKKSVR